MRKKHILKLLSLLAAVCITAGCNGSATAETTTLSTTTTAVTITVMENTTTNTKETAITEPTEEVLPEGWTMDELRNILVINGKMLTMPTTINKIMELDEKFSYEEEYIEEGDYLYNNRNFFVVDVMYDNINITNVSIPCEENNINQMLDSDINALSFDVVSCKKAGVNFDTSIGLNFNSSYEDILEVLGEPNVISAQRAIKKYEFHSNSYSFNVDFFLSSDNTINIILIKVIKL